MQVKTTYYKTKYGIYQANLKVCGGNRSGQVIKNFDKNKVDYIFVVTEDEVKYLIPSENIKSKTAISLGRDVENFIVS